MKFKTFDFEGTKIRVGITDTSLVMLVAEDISDLLGFTGADGGAARSGRGRDEVRGRAGILHDVRVRRVTLQTPRY